MTAARLVLERSTMMLLTSSKVSCDNWRCSKNRTHRFFFRPFHTDKSETSRMYILQGEPWYGVLPNEKGHGLNSLRREGRRAGDIKREKCLETSECEMQAIRVTTCFLPDFITFKNQCSRAKKWKSSRESLRTCRRCHSRSLHLQNNLEASGHLTLPPPRQECV